VGDGLGTDPEPVPCPEPCLGWHVAWKRAQDEGWEAQPPPRATQAARVDAHPDTGAPSLGRPRRCFVIRFVHRRFPSLHSACVGRLGALQGPDRIRHAPGVGELLPAGVRRRNPDPVDLPVLCLGWQVAWKRTQDGACGQQLASERGQPGFVKGHLDTGSRYLDRCAVAQWTLPCLGSLAGYAETSSSCRIIWAACSQQVSA
jgi:hypothetical protein